MTLTRRRFIAISAAATMTPLPGMASVPPVRRWTGHAMGARASLSISGLTQSAFTRITALVAEEIERLEEIFSLYRPESDLVRLNSEGQLENPPFELVHLLSMAGTIHLQTGGAFDPTIQPLWRLYAATAGMPGRHAFLQAQRLTGWGKVAFDSRRISYAVSGMAMTLNGIAQGYMTDRVADVLRGNGLTDVLVSVGEIAALGKRAADEAWHVGIAEREDATPEETIRLADRAIATSAPAAMAFDTAKAIGHIIDPRNGKTPALWRRISVIHPSAAMADGLSTAFSVMDRADIIDAVQRSEHCRLIAVDSNGSRLTAGA